MKNLIHFHKTHPNLLSNYDTAEHYNNRKIDLCNVRTHMVRNCMRYVEMVALNEIALHAKNVMYPEQTEIMRFPLGSHQPTHIDTYSDLSTDDPNAPPIVPQTEWAAICYLNDNYGGGELWFPKQEGIEEEFVYTPVAGEMVIFEGLKFEHGVKKVYKADRYTIPMWFTSNPMDMRPDQPVESFYSEDDYGSFNKIR